MKCGGNYIDKLTPNINGNRYKHDKQYEDMASKIIM